MDSRLSDKVILVTGAQHGIGAATAKAFAAEGAAVFLHYLRLPPEPGEILPPTDAEAGAPGIPLYRARQALTADQVVEAIRGTGGRAAAWEADLADSTVIPELFNRAEAAFGPVSVIVNNAANWEPDSFLVPDPDPQDRHLKPRISGPNRITAESHDRHFAVNSRAPARRQANHILDTLSQRLHQRALDLASALYEYDQTIPPPPPATGNPSPQNSPGPPGTARGRGRRDRLPGFRAGAVAHRPTALRGWRAPDALT